MSKELAKQTLELFDTPEKWNTFLELSNLRSLMRNQIFEKTKIKLVDYFNLNPINEWSFLNWGQDNWDYKWFLTNCTENSLGIWMNGVQVGFYYQGVKRVQALELFNSSKYSDLKKCFRPDYENGSILFYYEHGNFIFDSINDENFDLDSIAGYLLNEPEKYMNQVVEKVDNVRRNPEFLNLLKELNQELSEF
jgi:hypothetical protein